MHRRKFLATATALVAAPRFAWAQVKRRIAIVVPNAPASSIYKGGHTEYGPLIEGLEEHGWIEGQNLFIDRYSGNGDKDQFAMIAERVVSSKPEVIFTRSESIHSIVAATNEIPVVSVMGQNAIKRYAESLARPGGNFTGLAQNAGTGLHAKTLQLLHDAVPDMRRIAWLINSKPWEDLAQDRKKRPSYGVFLDTADRMGIEVVPLLFDYPGNEDTFRQLIASLADNPVDALKFDSIHVSNDLKKTIVRLANNARLPTITVRSEFVEFGVLMFYGTDRPDLYRRAAGYIDRILKGSDPAEMPIGQPTKINFIINLKTAKELGITFPTDILYRATQVIE